MLARVLPPEAAPFGAHYGERTRWMRAVVDAATPTRNSATGPCPLRDPSPTATRHRLPEGLRCDHVVQHRTGSGRRRGRRGALPPRVTCAVSPWAVAAHSCPLATLHPAAARGALTRGLDLSAPRLQQRGCQNRPLKSRALAIRPPVPDRSGGVPGHSREHGCCQIEHEGGASRARRAADTARRMLERISRAAPACGVTTRRRGARGMPRLRAARGLRRLVAASAGARAASRSGRTPR